MGWVRVGRYNSRSPLVWVINREWGCSGGIGDLVWLVSLGEVFWWGGLGEERVEGPEGMGEAVVFVFRDAPDLCLVRDPAYRRPVPPVPLREVSGCGHWVWGTMFTASQLHPRPHLT